MSAPSSSPVVLADKLERTYRMGDQEVRALRGVSLTVNAGEFVAIMGPSGSGKSTFMNMVGCLDRPTGGRILVAGQDVGKLSRAELAHVRGRYVGFVFQGFQLLPRTSALENVELPLVYQKVSSKERRARAVAALEKVGLGKRLDHTPAKLSGGQQQRVAIARALVTSPRLLLADEPTGNLDSETSVEVMSLLQGLNDAGLTVVLVTHEPDVAERARRLVTFKDGAIVADVPVAQRRGAA
jgi:putative ABC transport system ATP-binding protein